MRREEGFTLIESVVVLAMLGILLAITVPIVSALESTTSRVDNTYSNMNGQLLLSTTLQRLLRAAVAPVPPIVGSAPNTGTRTPFVPGTLSPTKLVFYANTGTAHGPVKVTARCTTVTTTHAYLCAPTSRFTLTTVSPERTTCPTSDVTSQKICSYTYLTSKKLTRTLVDFTHLQNGTDAKPLFVYSYGIQPGLGTPMTVTTVCVTTTAAPSGCRGGSNDHTTLAASHCFSAPTNATDPYASCPAGAVDQVLYDIQINAETTKRHRTQTTSQYGGLQAEEATGTFVLSPLSMLFDPTVG